MAADSAQSDVQNVADLTAYTWTPQAAAASLVHALLGECLE